MQILLKKGSQISGTVSNAKGDLVVNAKMDLALQTSTKANVRNSNDPKYFYWTTRPLPYKGYIRNG